MKKILGIKQVTFDKNLYPRTNYDWKTALNYRDAMKMGDIFPPIVVAKYGKKYILVDGKHRLEANRMLKRKHIQVEIKDGLSAKEIYIMAVKSNLNHGKALSSYDKANIIIKLKDLHYDTKQISKIINMPMGYLTKFSANRITNSITGKEIALKSEMKHFAGREVSQNMDLVQGSFQGMEQLEVIDEIIILLKNNLIDKRNKKVIVKLKELKKLLRKY